MVQDGTGNRIAEKKVNEEDMMTVMGVDIGGTKTAVCIATERGTLLAEHRIATDPDSAQETLECAIEAANGQLAQIGMTPDTLDAIGISAPGPMCSKRQMILQTPNLKGWNGFRVGNLFQSRFKRPVFMQNDANGAGLAEYLFGGCQGLDLIYLTMSTGIGGGVVLNGRVLSGVNDLGGEVGHITLNPDGPQCACGKRGCWEVYCGGKRFAERFRNDLATTHSSSLALERAGGNPQRITMKEICDAVRENDPFACSRWEEFIDHMAHATGILLQSFNPQAIILGTLAIHQGDLLVPHMIKRLPRYAWQASIDACRIEASKLTNIGELAAVAIALDGLRKQEG